MPTTIDVHYTWVGPPNRDGRDTEGPLPMMGRLKNTGQYTYKVYFWCLDRYVKDFQAKFHAAPGLTVRGIESFLATCTGTAYRWYYWYGTREDDIVKKVGDIINQSVPASARGWAGAVPRDVVNAKNVWSFFLLYTWGGYHFDTGIKPDVNRHLSLKAYKTFKAPCSPDECVVYTHHKLNLAHDPSCSAIINEGCDTFGVEPDCLGTNTARQYDVWALYSPRYDHRAWLALSWYCRTWKYLQDKRITDPNQYKQAYRSAVMNSIYTALSHDKLGHCTHIENACNWDWKDKHLVEELGVEKVFHGSHR